MARIVTIMNFKGGVGKTVSAIELSTALSRFHGKKTLLVDLDPQASATFSVMEQEKWKDWKSTRGTTYELFAEREHFQVQNAIVTDVISGKVVVPGFDLLPSNPDLVDVELSLADFIGYTTLQRAFQQVSAFYDYIICDCPPTFNPVTKNALWASNFYVIPTVPDFLSTYGISLMQRSIKKLFSTLPQNSTFSGPVLAGILLTRVKNTKLHDYYCQLVRYDYQGKVFKHAISDAIIVAEASDTHIPISALPAPKERAAFIQDQFRDLAGEFISRIQHIR